MRDLFPQSEPYVKVITRGGSVVDIGGFVGDVWKELQKRLGFVYTMSEGDSWGAYPYPNGTWPGMVGMIVRGQVDLSLSEFAFTNTRKEYVDYTVPMIQVRFACHRIVIILCIMLHSKG